MRIGMIGLDTSHSEIFTSLLNDRSATHHVPGGLITHAMPIYSEDLPISFERYPKYRDIVERRYDVIIVTEVDVLMDNVDAVIIGTVDGRPRSGFVECGLGCDRSLIFGSPELWWAGFHVAASPVSSAEPAERFQDG